MVYSFLRLPNMISVACHCTTPCFQYLLWRFKLFSVHGLERAVPESVAQLDNCLFVDTSGIEVDTVLIRVPSCARLGSNPACSYFQTKLVIVVVVFIAIAVLILLACIVAHNLYHENSRCLDQAAAADHVGRSHAAAQSILETWKGFLRLNILTT